MTHHKAKGQCSQYGKGRRLNRSRKYIRPCHPRQCIAASRLFGGWRNRFRGHPKQHRSAQKTFHILLGSTAGFWFSPTLSPCRNIHGNTTRFRLPCNGCSIGRRVISSVTDRHFVCRCRITRWKSRCLCGFCSHNNLLSSLRFSPKIVAYFFNISRQPEIGVHCRTPWRSP